MLRTSSRAAIRAWYIDSAQFTLRLRRISHDTQRCARLETSSAQDKPARRVLSFRALVRTVRRRVDNSRLTDNENHTVRRTWPVPLELAHQEQPTTARGDS